MPRPAAQQTRPRVKPELMSPAGHWPQLRAAVEAGADAVYFGLNHFSARAKVGFTLEELPEVIRTLHERAVKGFVTFNTLVFDHEVEQARDTILAISESGADSIIVQDAGIAELARRITPDLPVHGSTQMSITSAQGAELARSLGCCRVVLGRELSLADIRRIASQTDVELEIFVHGALCVSYSGQCFSSEAWGGRSANRGKCAQACRLSYELVVDGTTRDTGADRYLLSPGDLYALEQIPELIEIGVHCLKIEGRYKDAQYVALTTAAYRQAIDAAWEEKSFTLDAGQRDDLEQVYSRGLGAHFISGTNHQSVVLGRAPRHRGVKAGTVVRVGADFVDIKMEAGRSIKPGDGIVFDAADWRSPDEPEEGGNVYEVMKIGDHGVEETGGSDHVRLKFGYGDVDFVRIRNGDLIWRTHDPTLSGRTKKLTSSAAPVYTRRLDFDVRAIAGEQLTIKAKSQDGHVAGYVGEEKLQTAEKRPLDSALLETQLGRLGNSPFHLGTVTLDSPDPVFVRTAVLNDARRQLVESIVDLRGQPAQRRAVSVVLAAPDLRERKPGDLEIRMDLLVRNSDQLDAAIEMRPRSITLDYLELYGLRKSVNKIREAGIAARAASPRILKPGEQNVIRFLVSLDCDILIRSAGLLHDLVTKTDVPASRLHGDFSLNVANRLTAELFLGKGLSRITPTYDLNASQIDELATNLQPEAIEVVAYSHLPVFHTEHCVFCRFLSNGTDNTNCGHPCEKHRIAIRDASGLEHPVMADVGCRNTVFGAGAQTDPKWLSRWIKSGIRQYRIEFVHQNANEVSEISSSFAGFFAQSIDASELSRKLEKFSPHGTTEGSLFVPKDFKNLVQLS
ncbi:MAG: U32 family peptidase [Planctomycetota bacterium]